MNSLPKYILFLVVGFTACKPTQPTQAINYSEDLSIHRPEVSQQVEAEIDKPEVLQDPTPLSGHISAELDSVLAIIVAANKEKEYWDGYTIQVYNGLNRDEAYGIRETLEEKALNLPIRLEYRQPNYKVKVGLYFDQLTAHADLMFLKNEFSASLLIPEKIKLADYEISD